MGNQLFMVDPCCPRRSTGPLVLPVNIDLEPFNDWRGDGDVTNLSPFWEETARK